MPNNRIPLPPPMTARPRSYFGGEWTTPISLRLPPLSSAPGFNVNSGGLSRPHNDDGTSGVPRGNQSIKPDSPDITGNPESNLPQPPGLENYRTVVQPDLIGEHLVYKLASNGELLEITDTLGLFTTKSGKLLALYFGSNQEKNFYFVRKNGSGEYHFYNEGTDEIGPVIAQDQVTGLWSLQHRQADAWDPPSPSLQPGPTNPRTLSSQPSQLGSSTAPKHPLPPDEAPSLPPKRSRMRVNEMPPELVRGSGVFWENKKPATRQLAANLFRDGKIHDVTYSNDGKAISGKFDYRGEEYRFSYSSGKGSPVIFRNMDGSIAAPVDINGQFFAGFLHTLEKAPELPRPAPPPPAPPRPSMIRQNMPYNFRIPNELNPPAAGGFWDQFNLQTQYFLTELYRNGEIYGINFDSGTYGNPRLNAVMRYRGRDYSFTVGMHYRIVFASEGTPPGFKNGQSFAQTVETLASRPLP